MTGVDVTDREVDSAIAVPTQRLVSFLLAGQEYAVGIEQVREVTEVLPVNVIPQVPGFVRGIITIRGRVLVLVNLHALFGLEAATTPLVARRHVVIEHQGDVFAIEVDAMSSLRWFAEDVTLEAAPSSGEGGARYLKGILIQQGCPLMLLDVEKITGIPELERALASSRDHQLRTPFSLAQDVTSPLEVTGGERGLVCFLLGGEEYAIAIEKGQEVVMPLPATYVPFSPPFLRGVINLRGSILPLIDLCTLLSLNAKQRPRRVNRFLIITDERGTVAIEVDDVTCLRRVSASAIEALPPSMAGSEARFLEGIIPDEERPVLLLDWNKIMAHEEIVRLRGKKPEATVVR